MNNIKFTQEYVESVFKEKGCILLDKYKDTRTRMKYICKCENEREISFSKFRTQKHGCKICTGLEKYTQEQIESIFDNSGCKLISTYDGAHSDLRYICECGNESKTSLSNFQAGKRCVECGLKKLSDAFKLDIEYVKQSFINGGCTPLFKEYSGVHDKLEYICECGEKSTISFSDFQYGKRCWNCRTERIQKTMYSNGTQVCSSQQKYIHNVVGGTLNYPCENSTLDIFLSDEKIYIEFDGSGHDLSVKLGSISKDDFLEREKRRKYALSRRGYKEIRIISRKDKMPTKSKINEIIHHSKKCFNDGRSWIIFDIDDNSVEIKGSKVFFDFGQLKKIKKSDIL